jgi:hypothetical protein
MINPTTKPKITLPIQARPVHRDQWTTPAGHNGENGVEAAKSRCADLPGAARQMCYSAVYGFST